METTTEKFSPRIFFESPENASLDRRKNRWYFFLKTPLATWQLRFMLVWLCCMPIQRLSAGVEPVSSRHYTLFPTSSTPNPGLTISVSGSATAMGQDLAPGSVHLTVVGGVAPYKVVWSNIVVPSYQDVITTIYSGHSDMDTMVVDTTKIHHQLDSLNALMNNSNLLPNVYYAKVSDAMGFVNYVAGVVARPITWLTDAGTENVSVAASTSPSRNLGGVLFLPSDGKTITLNNKQSGLEFGYAVGQELLSFSDYHYFEMEAPSGGNDIRCGYAVVDNQNAATPTDMKYYLQFQGNVASLYANGTLNNQVTFTPGDLFALEVKNTNLVVYQNYSIISSGDIPVNTKDVYNIKTLLHDNGNVLKNLKVVSVSTAGVNASAPPVKAQMFTNNISALINDVTCGNTCNGSINATANILLMAPLGGAVPKTVIQSWSLYPVLNGVVGSSPIATAGGILGFNYTFSNLCAGDYQVRCGYTSGGASYALSNNFSVGYMPDWTGVTGVNIDPTLRSVSKSVNTSNCDAGAYSVNELSYSTTSTEWFEYTVQCSIFNPTSLMEKLRVGLTSNTSPSNLLSTNPGFVQYGISYNFYTNSPYPTPYPISIGINSPAGWCNVVVALGNTYQVFYGSSFTMADRFKIVKSGNTFGFYQNNVQIAPITPAYVTPSNDDLRIDISTCEKTSAVIKPRSSFSCAPVPVYAILKRQLDAQVYRVSKNKVFFKYDEEYQDTDSKLLFNIYDGSRTKVVNGASLGSLTPTVAFGDNRYMIDLNNLAYSNNVTLPPGFYILEVINEKKEPWFLRFKK